MLFSIGIISDSSHNQFSFNNTLSRHFDSQQQLGYP